ncbi:MAG TPA: hypothetical protein VHM30_01360 [Gemmatimonadaceae bacterium]|nr:hypothetical protein [Gemmatimonadaceae bacterium]
MRLLRFATRTMPLAFIAAFACSPSDFIPEGDPSGANVQIGPEPHPAPTTKVHGIIRVGTPGREGNFRLSGGGPRACSYTGKPGIDAGALVLVPGTAGGYGNISSFRLEIPRLIDARTSTGNFTVSMTVYPSDATSLQVSAAPRAGNGFGYVKVGGPETAFKVELDARNADGLTISARFECSR